MSKLGRNDPCHCGSGNKYKKCCLFGEWEAHIERKQENERRFQEWLKEPRKPLNPALTMLLVQAGMLDPENFRKF